MLYTDLRELKQVLEINPANTSEDVKLGFILEHVSSWIEEYINRPGLTYKQRTEYYSGTNTTKLLLRSRPVFSTPALQVYVDGNGHYGASSGSFLSTSLLTYGTDYCLGIDQDDGVSSRCGILIRLKDAWQKNWTREAGYLSPFMTSSNGSIKVVYYAGYTVDSLPAVFRMATNLLVARLRYLLPLGMEIGSESYEERSISLINERRDYLMSLVKPMLFTFRNWSF